MNIYIVIEHKKRELYSKLLLGFEAALKGNQVYLGNVMPLCQKRLLKPGIIHLKSITPSNRRIAEMKFLKNNGFMITSIDEEVGVVHDDTEYLNQRYGNVTVNLIDKLFAHGNFDLKNLINKFPKNKKKNYQFWKPKV